MAEDLHKPAGYCPHCEYPIDPGTCPECGLEVSSDTLVNSIAGVRRRRVVKYCLIAAPLLLVLAIVVYVNANDGWIEHIPTTLLLPFQGDYNGEVCIDLRRRFRSNQLTNHQAQRILKHHIADPVLGTDRHPPPGVPVRITIRYQYRNDRYAIRPGSRSLGNFTLWIDGNEVTPIPKRKLEAVYDVNPRSVHRSVWCPPLDVGRHQITLEGDFVFGWKNGSGNAIIYTHHARLSREVTVKGDVFDHVSMVGTNATARKLRGSIYALFRPYSYWGPRLSFYMQSQALLPVAGHVLVRRRGEIGFVHVGHIFLSNRWRSWAGVRLDALPGIEKDEWISVRVIPDPDVAHLNQADTCFDGVLMWQRVSASHDDGTYSRGNIFPSLPSQVVLNQTHGEAP